MPWRCFDTASSVDASFKVQSWALQEVSPANRLRLLLLATTLNVVIIYFLVETYISLYSNLRFFFILIFHITLTILLNQFLVRVPGVSVDGRKKTCKQND